MQSVVKFTGMLQFIPSHHFNKHIREKCIYDNKVVLNLHEPQDMFNREGLLWEARNTNRLNNQPAPMYGTASNSCQVISNLIMLDHKGAV